MKNYVTISLLLLITIIYAQELIPVIENYSNGNIYSITYHKTTLYGTIGEIQGLRTWLYDNKQIKIESHYKNGKKDRKKTAAILEGRTKLSGSKETW